MLFDFQRRGGDPVVDRWVDNVFIQDLTARAQPPRARFVRRKPVSLRALHVHSLDDIVRREPPDDVDLLIARLEQRRYYAMLEPGEPLTDTALMLSTCYLTP
jgi:hypothetical protein